MALLGKYSGFVSALSGSVATSVKECVTNFKERLSTDMLVLPQKPVRVSDNIYTENEYLVTSMDGLFLFAKDGLFKLVDIPCFGITMAKGSLYISTFCRADTIESRVYKFDAGDLLSGAPTMPPQYVYGRVDYNTSTRIHQISYANDRLYIANTGHNSIMSVDDEGTILDDLTFILDDSGYAIDFDHNHINTVFGYGDLLYFTCFKFGRTGLVGVTDKKSMGTWRFAHKGTHDIVVSGRDVFVSDSFGNRFPPLAPEGVNGYLTMNGKKAFVHAFEGLDEYMVRGYASTGGEHVIGLSAYWNKDIYSQSALGGLVVCSDDGSYMVHRNMPYRQFYDIIRVDGAKTDTLPGFMGFDDAVNGFCKYFGAPVYCGELGRRDIGRQS